MDNRRARETPNKNWGGIFLGLMMVLCASLMLVTRFYYLEIDGIVISVADGPLGIVSRVLLLVGGILILVFRRKGNYFAVGVYALTLGTSRLIRSLPNLVSESDIVFYAGLLTIALSANLAATGYNHLTVRMKNPLNMRYTTMTIIGLYVVVLFYFYFMMEKPTIVLEYLPDMIWCLPLYISLMLVLFSKEVVDNSPIGRINKFSAQMADKIFLGDEITVSVEDAAKIREGFGGSGGWKETVISGTSVREECVTFATPRGDRDVVLDRFEGDGNLYISVVDDRTDSFINGYRSKASSFTESDGKIELRDDIGVCAVLHVRGPERWISQKPGSIPIT